MTNPSITPKVNINPTDDIENNNEEIVNPAGLNNSTGKDTVGVGQPTTQSVNQGNSLPPVAKPVERKFIDQPVDFYDPQKDKDLSEAKNHKDSGSAKTGV